MTTEQALGYDQGNARTALSSGIASLILAALYLTPWTGSFVLYGSIVLGIVAIVFGVLAIKKGQSKAMAVTGLILGIVGALFGAAVIIFALVFVGAFEAYKLPNT
ncbi:hypothetical protein QBL02_13260 [Leucobacter sp. UT-8R-CII-1-4]|uniref:hypothetical protein n=1 Tax=Leucobacter sp. UT-8R-CII-1-4 TaxID=3040075 RepID=UPI0024A7C7A8|nr:hypothetical protein [Leucobacter sp. UT-8R-CII-1-4]MDI6024506.1 hypothetical protein [Leucobacter sp. UT-8R-CII-1-4]